MIGPVSQLAVLSELCALATVCGVIEERLIVRYPFDVVLASMHQSILKNPLVIPLLETCTHLGKTPKKLFEVTPPES